MDEQPTGPYRQDRATAARDPGPASHALRRGAPPRHAAGTREAWYTTVGPDPDPVYSPLADSPEPLENGETDLGIPPPELWYPPDEAAPRQRLPRRMPPGRGRRPRRRFPRWLPVAGAGVIVLIVAVAVVLGHGGTPAAQLAGRGTAAGTGNGSAAPGPGLQPVITRTAAEQVLARFTSINNQANKQYDNALLATIEGGSSYVHGYRHLPHGPGHRPGPASTPPSARSRPSTTSRASQPAPTRTSSWSRWRTRTWPARGT